MQTERIKRSVYSLMIVITISLLYGCTSKNSGKELSGNSGKDLSVALKSCIDTLKNNSAILNGMRIYNPDIIIKLYEKNGLLPSPKWTDTSNILQMISSIRNAAQDGLLPADYHLSEIQKLAKESGSQGLIKVKEMSRLDLMLTDALLLLSSHLAEGKTNPDSIYPQWSISRRKVIKNWDNFVDSTLLSKDISGALHNILPRHREYYNLKKALLKYRQFEDRGGWHSFSTDLPKLEIGLRHPDVPLLRERLEITQGDIEFFPEDEDLFNKALQDQVIIFQKANGLDADGVVGKTTIDALNIPVGERIETLEANLEKWRWLSDDLGKCYIRVNIADFSLKLLEDDKLVLHSLAIVGRPYRQTPIFSANLKYMEVNPEWVIPTQILKEEIVPVIKKNPAYLAENNMKILRMDGTELAPSSINWGNVNANDFPYMIIQDPCPKNPLGKIVFMFPNEYSVYIHDTPSQYLFNKSSRALSHGCIRINKALELAEYLIRYSNGWDTAHLQKAIALGKKEIISLKNPIPVYILYLTASADDDGSVTFAKDIYDRDQLLIDALKQGPSEQGKKLAESGYISEPLLNISGNSFNKRGIP